MRSLGAGKMQRNGVEVFAEGNSLIAVARISGRDAVYGLKTITATGGEKTVVAQYR